jgi:hypothetical protein
MGTGKSLPGLTLNVCHPHHFHVITHVFQVVAVYPFVARNNHEVSLQAGQPVRVLEAQDKKGNPEWSLVEVNGQRGYVPSSFLARAPAPGGWSLPC